MIRMQLTQVVDRLRAGDQEVIREFVAKYEPFIRRNVRRRITYLNLQAAADSADICQSALGSFLNRCAAGDFDLSSRSGLENLLLTIATRKFARMARRELAPARNRFRTVSLGSNIVFLNTNKSDPEQDVDFADMLKAVEARLPPRERSLFARRREGVDWNRIAEEEGDSCEILRKRLSRAIRKVIVALKLDTAHA